MKRLIILMICVLGITGCIGRKVVINPEDISQHNDVDWKVISNSTTMDTPNIFPENNLEQRNNGGWELGE